jgi:hypothetical protein
VRENRNAIAFANAERAQKIRGAIRARVQLRVRESFAGVRIEQRFAVRREPRAGGE